MFLRDALRSLLRAPVSLLTAAVTLGASLAVALAVFSVVDGVIFRPLPYRDADRLVYLVQVTTVGSRELSMLGMTPAQLDFWRSARHIFEAIEVYEHGGPVPDADGDYTNAVTRGGVTPAFLDLIGVRPMIGPGLTRGGDHPDELLISDASWRGSLGADPRAVGRTLRIGTSSYTIVGVMPRAFRFQVEADVWARLPDRISDTTGTMQLAKLQKGVSLETAQRWVNEYAVRLGSSSPAWVAGCSDRPGSAGCGASRWKVVPMSDMRAIGRSRPALLALVGGPGILLLLACATVTGLLLVRTVRRTRELATRLALGATKGDLLRHMAADLLVLGLMSAGVALFGVWVLLAVLPTLVPAALAVWLFESYVPRVDLRLVTILLTATTGAVILSGLLPMRRVLRLADSAVVAGEQGLARRGIRRRTAQILQGIQVGAATALLLAAGLLLTAFTRLVTEYPGFDPHQLVYEGLVLPKQQFPTSAAQELGLRDLERQLALHGVVGRVSFGSAPLRTAPIDVRAEDGRVEARVWNAEAWPGYLEVIGARLLDGRTFEEQDTASGARVVVVDQRLADRLWPGRPAVGQRLLYGVKRELTEVVGVVAPFATGIASMGGTLYRPMRQQSAIRSTTLVARIAAGASIGAGLAEIRGTARRLGFAVPTRGTGSQLRASTMTEPRFYLAIAALPALTSAVIALLGFYGLLSELALSRRRELAVRAAVGASPMRLWSVAVGAAIGPLIAGVSAGLVAGLWSASGLSAVLYETSTYDPLTCVTVPLLWGGVAFSMAAFAASGARRFDIVEQLRQT
jgi:predicted permease